MRSIILMFLGVRQTLRSAMDERSVRAIKTPEIRIVQYVTKGSFDGYLWQIQEQKLRFITQVMTGKAITRSCEDVDMSVLSAAEFKAIATDNPMALEKMTAENEVTRLNILRSSWQNERTILSRNIEYGYPNKIATYEQNINAVEQDIAMRSQNTNGHGEFYIELVGHRYTERSKAGDTFALLMNLYLGEKAQNPMAESKKIGSFCGFGIYLDCCYQHNVQTLNLLIKGSGEYTAYTGDSGLGNITRLENLVNSLEEKRVVSKQRRQRFKSR